MAADTYKRPCFYIRALVCFLLLGVFWILFESIFNLRQYVPDKLVTNLQDTIGLETSHEETIHVEVKYAPCEKIPRAPAGRSWAEEVYRNDNTFTDLTVLPDAEKSLFWLDTTANLKIGDTIKVRLRLVDMTGKRRSFGGDLIRVWIRDRENQAAVAANVIDAKDGSYVATTKAFWVGKPEVIAAIIAPREVIALAFKRRYVCPPVTVNTALFEHPKDKSIREETPCNYDPEVPGFPALCNFTADNYGRPWFCGKPRNQRLMCTDWTTARNVKLVDNGMELQRMSPVEQEIMLSLHYQPLILSKKLQLTVESDSTQIFQPTKKCNELPASDTWVMTSPTGFLFHRKWTNKLCRIDRDKLDVVSCLKRKKVMILGDSTTRQFFENIDKRIPCEWVTDTWERSGKHRSARCVLKPGNETIYDLSWSMHELPFLTAGAPKSYYRSLAAYFSEIKDDEDVVLILHLYSHFLNYHSHVYYEAIRELNKSLQKLFKRNKVVKVILKGPHSFAFSKESTALEFPQAYADVHSLIMFEQLKEVRDRAYYLEALDVTVSTEQWHIHAEEYIITELVDELFGFICPY